MLVISCLRQFHEEKRLEMESLLLGIDLGKHYSQISVYDEKKKEIVTVSPFPTEDQGLIPTIIGVTEDKKAWVYGRECMERAGVHISDMLETIEQGKHFSVYGVEFSPKSMMGKFLKKLLLLVKNYYPFPIKKLVVTVETKNSYLEDAIFGGLEKMGIGKDRAFLQTYEESYVKYALGQKKELWFQDIGLFDFNERGLYYKQISIDRSSSPMAAYVIKKDYTQWLNQKKMEEETKERLACTFLNLAKEALHKQSISTIYITGEGFLNSFANEVLPQLCVGRRVFAGFNLYTRGACYKAMELAGRKNEENYVFMGEGTISCNIFLPVYKDGRNEDVILSKFGTPWQKAGNWAEVILDEENEVRIIINDPLKKEDRTRIIPLEGLPDRPNRTTRLFISIEFLNDDEFVIVVKDMGFGNFYKTSNRIWEKRIKL